ncbi:GNAT family N-acetyltransferase [Crocinitomicaceae bacterium]|nr:GNAT family N-acetyltransferase [Crocinitomicaceae bacterium]MDB3906593.1 GNAT family N-acetyltransferase [Crocinitomicaceae bacterium]
MKLLHSESGVALRKIQVEDRERLVVLANNPKVANNLRDDFPHPYTIEDADQFIMHAQAASPTLRFCIEKDGLYVGNIGIHPQEDIYLRNAEIGYFIGEGHWCQGIASQAVKMIVDYGFQQLDYHRIFAGVFSYNIASKKVLENAGFEYEGASIEAVYKNGEFFDELRFAIINPNH